MKKKSFIETNDPNIDLSEIMDNVKFELSLLEKNINTNAKPHRSSSIKKLGLFDSEKPVSKKDIDNTDVSELLNYNGIEFIINAFLDTIKRAPFEYEIIEYSDCLIDQKMSKIDIILKLRNSVEGKKINKNIDSLKRQILLGKIYTIPFLGRIIRIITAILQFPTILKNFTQFQQFMHREIYYLKKNHNKSINTIISKLSYQNEQEQLERIKILENNVNQLKDDIIQILKKER